MSTISAKSTRPWPASPRRCDSIRLRPTSACCGGVGRAAARRSSSTRDKTATAARLRSNRVESYTRLNRPRELTRAVGHDRLVRRQGGVAAESGGRRVDAGGCAGRGSALRGRAAHCTQGGPIGRLGRWLEGTGGPAVCGRESTIMRCISTDKAEFKPVALGRWATTLGLGEDFSGHVTYRRTVSVPKELQGGRLLLDLGGAEYAARVSIDGQKSARALEPVADRIAAVEGPHGVCAGD